MRHLSSSAPTERLQQIALARSLVLQGASAGHGLATPVAVAPWIQRSWQRCLAQGRRPEDPVDFEPLSRTDARHAVEGNHHLRQAARPVLQKLGQAMADTRYFAILANAEGIVIDAHGPMDRSDRRVDLITRIGVDLSERNIGTSAIGAALREHHPVWLHRGEHFFHDTGIYSCAGAPLFGPDGRCVGMLDLTGVDTAERPELMHLVAQSARSIENELVRGLPHALLVRVNWPGHLLGGEADGLVCLDGDGWVLGLNPTASQMLDASTLRDAQRNNSPLHANDLFAMAFEWLFDAARTQRPCVDVPLWSGLRLSAQALLPQQAARQLASAAPAAAAATPRLPLKDMEAGLIQQAVREARGNVAEAARALGISRATVYRKLGRRKPG